MEIAAVPDQALLFPCLYIFTGPCRLVCGNGGKMQGPGLPEGSWGFSKLPKAFFLLPEASRGILASS